MSTSYLNYTTGGIYPSPNNHGPLLSNGMPVFVNPVPRLNLDEIPNPTLDNLNLSPNQISSLKSIATLRDPYGNSIIPGTDTFINMGSGYTLAFDPDTLQGRITPALSSSILNSQRDLLDGAMITYTGSDIRLMIESSETPADGRRYAKQLLEATTLSISVHREVGPVRAGGFINPKGFALGTRTIAGTLILTQFTADVLMRFLQGIMLNDGSKDTVFTKVDQLPPFNITVLLTNEAGYASYRSLLGVKFVTDGAVYSIQDLFVEQTLSWMATDFTPLMPLTLTNMYRPVDPTSRTTSNENTPTRSMRQSRI